MSRDDTFGMYPADGSITEYPKRYYRTLVVDFRLMERWFNLPEGFQIDFASIDQNMLGLTVRVKCPEEPQYEVPVETPTIGWQVLHTAPDGRQQVSTYWPDLGQEEPPSPFADEMPEDRDDL